MSPRPGDPGWVPLPRPQTPPRRQRRDFDDEEDAIIEERRPGQNPFNSPRISFGSSSSPRTPGRQTSSRRRRNPFDEPEIIEIAPDSARPSSSRRQQDSTSLLRRETRDRMLAEQEADRQRNTVLVAHNTYQQILNDATDQASRLTLDNQRLREQRDEATHRAALAEREANIAMREKNVQKHEIRLDSEERREALRPRIFQEARQQDAERVNAGLEALRRAGEDRRREERRQDVVTLHRRNRDRDRERGVRRGSPVRYGDGEGRRDRRR